MVLREADALDTLAKHFAAGLFELPHTPVEKDLPDGVLLRGVILPPLFDECCSFVCDGLDHVVSKKKTARDLSRAACALICLRLAHTPLHTSRVMGRVPIIGVGGDGSHARSIAEFAGHVK